jgi:transcription antitermination factor NusG
MLSTPRPKSHPSAAQGILPVRPEPMTTTVSPHLECPPMLSPRAMTIPGIGGTWVVVEVRPRNEKDLTLDLLDAGFDFFLPLVKRVTVSHRRRRIHFVPINELSGYVFAASPEEVPAGAMVPPALHQFLASHHAVFDLIEVHRGYQPTLVRELTELHGAVIRNPHFGDNFVVRGAKCRVRSGPFEGKEGVIDDTGQGWAILPITILGRAVPTRIPVEDLEPI